MIFTKNIVCKRIILFVSLSLFFSCKNKSIEVPKEVTFNQHIVPIIFQNCSPCHSKNEAGPFPLTNYNEVKRKGKTILKVIHENYMPPWPADTTYSRFLHEKKITEFEKRVLLQWLETDMKEGAGTKPQFAKSQAYHGRKPDLVLRMKEPFFIKGNNRDNFIIMKFPFELPEETYVDFIEFVPDNKKLLHHVNTHLISFEENKKSDLFGGEYWYNHEDVKQSSRTYHEVLELLNDDGSYPLLTPSVSNYLPGMKDVEYPAGIGGYVFPKKGILYANDIHYGPSPIDTFDNSYYNIYFSKTKPKRLLKEMQLGTLGKVPVEPTLVIPANEIDTFRIDYKLQEDISLLTIVPHMHLLGSYYEAFAILPNSEKIPLIKIPKWNFRWQFAYTFSHPVHLPLGTRIHVVAVMDNTAQNPLNPNDPPEIVIERDGSMRTTDEMLQFIFVYVPYQEGDEKINLNTY